ncbi:hypothetical protein LIER_04149 [Lithospermum erythrorhizon]|uniref:SWIM-type domain-containing protein n=1 Tax=Lithospermum erythrorhizon TaxID=34254 RepID=A0AAV3NVP0_LITER
MLNTCFDEKPTSHHTWLSFIYIFRKQWSSAWVNDAFTAGKTTTQLSEQLNAFARHYLKPSMHVSKLLRNFQALLDDLHWNEHNRDFHMQNTIPANNFPNSSVMNHAASLFTPNVVKLIQYEYKTGMNYTMKTFDVEQYTVSSYEETLRIFSGSCKLNLVQHWENKNGLERTLVEEELVRLDMERSYIKCSCRFFENHWLMCRHILRAMEVYGAFGDNEFCRTIPNEFIIG